MARCERRKDVHKGETDPQKIWQGSEGKQRCLACREDNELILSLVCSPVLSSQIAFEPKGSQNELFGDSPPRPAVDGILLAKMRGGQVRTPSGALLIICSN